MTNCACGGWGRLVTQPCPECGAGAPSSCTVDSIVVPRELWERIVLNVSCQVNSPVRHAGRACYDRGLVDKETTDQLLAAIRRHNSVNHVTSGGTQSPQVGKGT